MQAVKKFSLDKKVRLATYAMWWIKAAINDYILRSWSLVKIGTIAAQKKLFYNLNRIKARLGLFDNKELEPEVVKTIDKELVVEEKDVVEMNRRLGGDKSLNVTAGDDSEDEKIDFVVDARQNIEGALALRQEKQLRRDILRRCLASLNEREQYIIAHRMLTDEPETLDDIGVRFGISRERANDYPHQFSGGMKQRVIIAISLVLNPKILLADEPTTALDVTIQAQVLDTIQALRKKLDMSMILITHDLGIVAQTCEQVAIIYGGEVVEYADVFTIFENRMHPYTQGLFNSIPKLNEDVNRLVPIEGLMPDPTNLPTGCKFCTRCQYATDRCREEHPEMIDVGNGHLVRCFRAENTNAGGEQK